MKSVRVLLHAAIAAAALAGALAAPTMADASGKPLKWVCVPVNPAVPWVMRCYQTTRP